jgi:two-component system invasion response regulator UvrY
MVRIALADGCPIVCRGLKGIFRRFPTWKVQFHASDAPQLDRLLRKKIIDLLILEMQLRGAPDGLTLIEKLLFQFPRTAILLYTANRCQDLAVRALRAGAAGYVHKESPENELIEAVTAITSGATYVDAALKEKLALLHLSKDRTASPLELLSRRERQVFDGLASGRKLTEIAAQLALSPKTMSSYRTRIFQKLPLHSDADLVRLALHCQINDTRPLPRAQALR